MNGPERDDDPPALSAGELEGFLAREFPNWGASGLVIEAAWRGGARLRQPYRGAFLRPGGTISGPTMMMLADVAMYVAVLSAIGPVPLAVTTSLNINFLRRPAPADLVAEAELMKLGRRLAVGQITIRSAVPDAGGDLVAHATSTYSMPHPRDS